MCQYLYVKDFTLITSSLVTGNCCDEQFFESTQYSMVLSMRGGFTRKGYPFQTLRVGVSQVQDESSERLRKSVIKFNLVLFSITLRGAAQR